MIWLAKIQIDYETIAKLQVRDCYGWHKQIWEFFPGRSKGHPLPCLFRVIPKDQGSDLWLLCREEPTKPEWVHNEKWQIKPINDKFPFHRKYQFDLLANPTCRDKARDCWNGRERIRKKHRKFNLKTAEEQSAWLVRKAESNGFRLLGKEGSAMQNIYPRNDFQFEYRDGSRGVHVGVRYKGVLEVTDRATFLTAFKNGIGSAKAFGFGLLLLVPLKD